MSDEIYKKLRDMMRNEGAWSGANQFQVYTTAEYITEFGNKMSDELKSLLTAYVGRMQVCLDERVLEERG